MTTGRVIDDDRIAAPGRRRSRPNWLRAAGGPRHWLRAAGGPRRWPRAAGELPDWLRAAGEPVALSVLVTAVGALLWATVFPRVGTDLSAQIARAAWASQYPGSAYLFSWYGGIYPASYSLIAPYLLAAIGTRAAMGVAAVVSAGLLSWLFVKNDVPRPRAAALWTAVALLTNLTAGRATFTLGVAAGAGCMAMTQSGRLLPRIRLPAAVLLALLTSLLSPVAGLFLGVAAAALLLTGRRAGGLAIGLAAAVPIGVVALLSDGGVQPIGPQNAVPSLLSAAGVLFFVPPRWRAVRIGAVSYGLGVPLVWAMPSPVGSNIERLGLLLAGPLLAGLGTVPKRLLPRVPQHGLLALALVAVAGWQVAQPVQDLAHGNAPPYAPETAALVGELRTLHADTARVEAVPQYGHWESEELASAVPLARGWERQVDMARNPLFYGRVLTPQAYYDWLRRNAVRYVAISAAPPDFSAIAEAQIVRSGQPWLVPVWHNSFWRLYRVAGAQPLASAPATVVSTSPASIRLWMGHRGTTVIRVYWSPLLRAGPGATLARRGMWTSLTARRPGYYTVFARY
jgi:hypothetical protein